jgi:membrane associated rhomboid family serine protease
MFIPIGDEPNARTFPVVNYALIAVSVFVFAFTSLPLMSQGVDPGDPMLGELLRELVRQHPGVDPRLLIHELGGLSAHDLFLMRWGYRAAEPSLITLVTAMFLHAGWLHIIGNMLFLWIYGDNVEHRLGHLGYLGVYLATGAAATLAYAAFLPESAGHTPLVGASGAISGVLGCYFVWFPRNKVRLLIALLPIYVDVWRVNARVVLGIYVVIDNLVPLLVAPAETSGVAFGAHLGGFLAGAALAVVIDRLAVRRDRSRGELALGRHQGGALDGPRVVADPRDVPADAHTVIALADRDPVAALQAYHALPPGERRRVAPAVLIDLADWLVMRGASDAAVTLYRQVLSEHRQDTAHALALLGLGRLLLQRGEPARAYQYLSQVLALGAANALPREVMHEARRLLAEIATQQKLQVRSRRWQPR